MEYFARLNQAHKIGRAIGWGASIGFKINNCRFVAECGRVRDEGVPSKTVAAEPEGDMLEAVT